MPTPLTRAGRLMLACLNGPDSVAVPLEEFKKHIDLRPDINLTEEQCQEGLDAMLAAGLVECPEDGLWRASSEGHESLTGPPAGVVLDPNAPVEAVQLDFQPGVATTKAEAM